MSDGKVQRLWVELIVFQHCEVRVEIIGVLLGLLLNVFFEELKVNGIVAGEKLKVIEVKKEISMKHSPFNAFQHFWNRHRSPVVGFN
jgi:hypothetical protein